MRRSKLYIFENKLVKRIFGPREDEIELHSDIRQPYYKRRIIIYIF